jgi:hypothetical protein
LSFLDKLLQRLVNPRFLSSAPLAAVFYRVPHFFPFFAPGKWLATGLAVFLRQMLLFVGHGKNGWLR